MIREGAGVLGAWWMLSTGPLLLLDALLVCTRHNAGVRSACHWCSQPGC